MGAESSRWPRVQPAAKRCCSSVVAQLDRHRRVVGRLLPFASLAIDATRQAALRERRGEKNMVDAQAGVLRKRELPVVPPAEGFRRLLEQPEAVGESDGKQRAK